MPSCAFKKCTNNSRNTNKADGVTFHRFPNKPRVIEKWIEVIQLDQKDDQWFPSDFSRICSVHFKKEDFFLTPRGLRKIQACAVPFSCPSKESNRQEESGPGDPLFDVDVSDTDSVFDKPRKIHLKKQLLREQCKRKIISKENIKLKKQIKDLKSKNTTLRKLLKKMKNKKFLNKEHFNELTKKAKDAKQGLNKDLLATR